MQPAAVDLLTSRARSTEPAPATTIPAASADASRIIWSGLPESVLTRALECVNVRSRSSSCALVSSTWSAAAAATRRVSLTPRPCPSSSQGCDSYESTDGLQWQTQSRAFVSWLSNQTQTTALNIQISKEDHHLSLQQLAALPKLRQLQLCGFKPDPIKQAVGAGLHVQLAPRSSSSSSSSRDEEEPSDGSNSTYDDVIGDAHDANPVHLGESAGSDHEVHSELEAASSEEPDHEIHGGLEAAGREQVHQDEAASDESADTAAAGNRCRAAVGSSCSGAARAANNSPVGKPPDGPFGRETNSSSSSSSSSSHSAAVVSTQLLPPRTDCNIQRPARHWASLLCNSLAALTCLTKLVMCDVMLKGGPAALQALSVLTPLQHLDVGWCGPKSETDAVPGWIFQSLLQLTHLSLHCGISSSTLTHLSNLQQLQQLKLGLLLPLSTAAGAADVAVISCLQQLTALTLFGAWFPMESVIMPWLDRLVGLENLALHSVVQIEPAALSSCTLLHSLQLRGCVKAHPAGLSAGSLSGSRYAGASEFRCSSELSESAAGVQALLQLLPKLQHLTQLSLPGVLSQAVPNVAAYSALTASSALRKLDISRAVLPTAFTAAGVPAAAAAAARVTAAAGVPEACDTMPTNRQAPSATHPAADCAAAAFADKSTATGGPAGNLAPSPEATFPALHCAASADACNSSAQIADSCFDQPPRLNVVDSWQYIFPPNRQLPFLTQLCLAEVEGGADAVAPLVKCCPQLQQLTLKCSSSSSSSSGGSSGSPAGSSTNLPTNSSNCDSKDIYASGSCSSCSPVPLHQQQQQQQHELLPLAQLSQLTSLAVDNFHSPGAAAAIAQATQLQKLHASGHCTPLTCLQQLTALVGLVLLESVTGVEQLKVDRRTHPPAVLELRNKASFGTPPDVHFQLQQHCKSRRNNSSQLDPKKPCDGEAPEAHSLDSCGSSKSDGSSCCCCCDNAAETKLDSKFDPASDVAGELAAPAANAVKHTRLDSTIGPDHSLDCAVRDQECASRDQDRVANSDGCCSYDSKTDDRGN